MGLLGPVLRLIGIEADAIVTRIRDNAIAFGAMGLFVAIAIVFALMALYTWLAGWIGPLWAPLVIAGAALVIALIIFIILRLENAATARREAERRRQEESNAAASAAASAAIAALPALLESTAVRAIGVPLGLYLGFLLLSRRKGSRPTTPPPPPPDSGGGTA